MIGPPDLVPVPSLCGEPRGCLTDDRIDPLRHQGIYRQTQNPAPIARAGPKLLLNRDALSW